MDNKKLNCAKRRNQLAQVALSTALCFCLPAGAAELTDLADAPLSSSASEQVPPNIMFILDDSGSMAWSHLPDIGNTDTIEQNTVGYRNHLCNPMYYDPSENYKPPVNADGTQRDNMDFDEALYNGFITTDKSPDTNSAKIDLGSQFRAYDTETTANISGGAVKASAAAAHYYKWKGSGTPSASDCSKLMSSPGSNWEKVTASDFTDADKTNFANWYSYYRTRMLLMKTAAGRAFSILDKHYRVGFITINPMSGWYNPAVSSTKYLKIAEFDYSSESASGHKKDWYDLFYKQVASGGTPLREALSRAGRHFAGKSDGINNGMSEDPLQYSCQPNFSILTTDGTWNGNAGQTISGGSIGNRDGDLAFTPRPMYDGGEIDKKYIQTHVEWRYRSRNSGNPRCNSGGQQRATKQTRTVTVTTTTTQYGGSSTSTSTGTTQSESICLPDNVDRTTDWEIVDGSQNNETTYVANGSASNTLADVAEYYYRTDLRGDTATRTGPNGEDINIGADNVPPGGTGPEDDKATHQHMTTFTVGLGVSGKLTFDPNYKSATSGDFQDIRDAKKGWPDPTSSDKAKTDDLWHAAVNGRGQAFSAQEPSTLATSLQSALSNIQARVASSAAAATSNLEPTETDRLVFLPKYVSAKWTGEIEAHLLNLTTGEVEEDLTWSAQERLDNQTEADCDDRNIYLYRKGASNNLVDFSWNSQNCASGATTTGLTDEKSFFEAGHINGLSQWLTMTDGSDGTVDQKSAAAGANLVNYLRGQRGKESYKSDEADQLYREREHVLGDIVGAQPVYVAAPAFAYSENDYATFKSNNASRAGMVYAASNDGMLHALKVGTVANDFTDGGSEAWAFIPRTVLPNLYKLADINWASKHEFLVDGSPVVGDIYDTSTSTWKTILVAGLNKGGKAYYALDITNPNNPKALWEFAHSNTCYDKDNAATHYADCHIGYSFGNPIVTKIAGKDASNNEWQKWVVLVTSGHNNVNETPKTGDGVGYLYVLDASSGKILHKIGTGHGDSGVGDDAVGPSGLTKINNWVVGDAYFDAKSSAAYGGDLFGNIYRFDLNVDPPTVKLIGTAKDSSGKGQPITTKPELAEVGSPPSPYVYVATGRYLAGADVSNVQTQSVYAIKDPGAAAGYSDLRAKLLRLTMTGVNESNQRFVSCTANCNSTDGWMVDLPDAGERVNVDMKLQLGTLMVLSNVPKKNTCEPGGYSYANYFNYASGQSPLGIGKPVGGKLSGSLAVGFNVIRLPNGKVIVISTDAAGNTSTSEAPIGSGAPSGKRISWRELLG